MPDNVAMPSSVMDTRLCNSIMRFIFNLQRKKSTIRNCGGIYSMYIYCMQNSLWTIQYVVLIFLLLEHLLEPCSCKHPQTRIYHFSGLISLAYWHLLGHFFNMSVSVDTPSTSLVDLPCPNSQFKHNLNTNFNHFWL